MNNTFSKISQFFEYIKVQRVYQSKVSTTKRFVRFKYMENIWK